MIEHSQTGWARQRIYLEQRRAVLTRKATTMREETLELWRKAWESERGGGEYLSIERRARQMEETCARIMTAILTIDKELGN